MKVVFKDFNESLSQLRLAIDNEVCALFIANGVSLLGFDEDEDRLSIAEEDETWRVNSIEYQNDSNKVVINTESGFETDFTDCNTDDMVAVYEAVYNKLGK